MKKTHGFEKSSLDAKARDYEQNRQKSTVEKLFDKFIKDKRFLENRSERTLDSYSKDVFPRWVRFIGYEMPTQERLEDFVMGMRECGFSIATCNLTIRSFNSFLSWLYKHEHIKKNLRLEMLKETKRVLKTFSDAQLQVLLNWRPNLKSRNEVRLHVLIYLLSDTGIRISEALSLTLDRCNFDSLLITVMGKGNKERTIPISIDMRKVLYKYIEKYRQSLFPTEWVFCTSSGTTWSYQNACRELMKLCRSLDVDMDDIDGVFHAFRRRFARSYVKNGGNLFYLQQILGHTTLQMTKAYVTAEEEDLQQEHHRVGLLGRLLGRKK